MVGDYQASYRRLSGNPTLQVAFQKLGVGPMTIYSMWAFLGLSRKSSRKLKNEVNENVHQEELGIQQEPHVWDRDRGPFAFKPQRPGPEPGIVRNQVRLRGIQPPPPEALENRDRRLDL